MCPKRRAELLFIECQCIEIDSNIFILYKFQKKAHCVMEEYVNSEMIFL
jgi:hypothetical protein